MKSKTVRQKKPFERIWSTDQEEILRDNYFQYNQRELAQKFLPSFTPIQINQKKMDMGFIKGEYVWSENERALLLENGANYTSKEMIKRFLPNKTSRQIVDMRKYFGIRRRKLQN